ncbi:MAG: hypothetical protein ABSD92_02625 [Candidatus Bathyarchaeia archaeon]
MIQDRTAHSRICGGWRVRCLKASSVSENTVNSVDLARRIEVKKA